MKIERVSSTVSPEQLAQAIADEVYHHLQNPAVLARLFRRKWEGPAVALLAQGAREMISHDVGANINALARLFVAIAPTVEHFYDRVPGQNRLVPKQQKVEV